MGSSLRLFSVRGIDLRLHVTFPLILLWAALQFGLATGNLGSALFGVVAISILFVLVTLHELGHSFAAQQYGVPVKQIVLSPLGGVAQLGHIPEKPIQEFVIAIAGPAVNLLIALLMSAVALIAGINIGNPLAILSGIGTLSLTSLFLYIFVYNIFLALFNLIPAFPLDGGRILRSLLAMRWDYVRATDTAALIGRVVAVMLGVYGLFNGGIFLIFIAIFIYAGATQEAAYVRRRGQLRGLKVQQAYSSSAYRLDPESTIQQATNLSIYGGQHNFPIVSGETLVGFLPQRELAQAVRSAVPHTRVGSVMRRDIAPVEYDDDLFEVEQRFRQHQVDALPVVGNGRFLGLISQRQIQALRRLISSRPGPIPGGQSA